MSEDSSGNNHRGKKRVPLKKLNVDKAEGEKKGRRHFLEKGHVPPRRP